MRKFPYLSLKMTQAKDTHITWTLAVSFVRPQIIFILVKSPQVLQIFCEAINRITTFTLSQDRTRRASTNLGGSLLPLSP